MQPLANTSALVKLQDRRPCVQPTLPGGRPASPTSGAPAPAGRGLCEGHSGGRENWRLSPHQRGSRGAGTAGQPCSGGAESDPPGHRRASWQDHSEGHGGPEAGGHHRPCSRREPERCRGSPTPRRRSPGAGWLPRELSQAGKCTPRGKGHRRRMALFFLMNKDLGQQVTVSTSFSQTTWPVQQPPTAAARRVSQEVLTLAVTCWQFPQRTHARTHVHARTTPSVTGPSPPGQGPNASRGHPRP